MRGRCRELDWASTPLGPVESWSPCLLLLSQVILASGFPMIILWGPELIQLYNDAYVPFLAAKHPGGLGVGNRECWPEVWHLNAPIYERVLAGETVSLQDAHYPVTRNGAGGPTEDLYITLSYSPVPNGMGGVGGVLVTLLDTTAQVQGRIAEAERLRLGQALETSRSTILETVFREAPSFLAVYRGPSHVYELVNDSYARLIGVGRDVIGKTLIEALPEMRGQGFDVLLDRVLESGEPLVTHEIPVQLLRTHGAPIEDRVVSLTYLPMAEPDGTRSGVIAHGTDVTEYVRDREEAQRLLALREEALAAAEELRAEAEVARQRIKRLQGLTAALAGARTLEDIATIVVAEMVDAIGARTGSLALLVPDGSALQLARTVGFPERVATTMHLQPLAMDSPLTEAFRTATAVWIEQRDGADGLDVRYPIIAPLWREMRVHSAAFLPLIVAGEAIGVISFGFPESGAIGTQQRRFLLSLAQQSALAVERARLFSAERLAREAAETANRAKSDFLATMSHELRTPLNAIGGYAELIEMGVYGPITAQQRTAIERMLRSQAHLLGLINGVLNYAKVAAGAVPYLVEEVEMHEVLSTCEALIIPLVRKKALEFDHHACPTTLRALADREKVKQVLLNLLSNAVKFTAQGGRVTMSCELQANPLTSDWVLVRVSDTGHGITPEALDRVFQPFVQEDGRLTRTEEGTGLGLSISRDLARGMGGDLTVVSAVGVGSTFTLSLPVA